MALTADDVLAGITELHKKKPMYGHPLWVGMVDGTWTLDQIKYICLQHGVITLWNHNYHGRLYVNCPSADWRERIAEVVYEEATGRIHADGVSHHKLYLNFGKGLGMSRDEMIGAKYCGGAEAFRAYFIYICGKTFLEGVSAHMLAGEAAIPGLYSKIAKNLQNKFGLSDEAVAYWVVHDTADGDHSDVGRDLLAEFAPTDEDKKLVLKTVETMIDCMYVMYDDIYRNVQKIKPAGQRQSA